MRGKGLKGDHGLTIAGLFVLLGVILNVILAYITYRLNLPIFLDMIGTVVVACVGGTYPGILTAVLSSILCCSFNRVSMYFSVVSIGVALLSSLYERKYSNRGYLYKLYFAVATGFMAGGFTAFIQWHLFLAPQNTEIAKVIGDFSETTGLPYVAIFVFVNIIIGILDKGISVGIALNILYFIPQKIKHAVKYGGWKQKPLSNQELEQIKEWSQTTKYPMRKRLTKLLFIVSVVVIIIMSFIEISMFFTKDIQEKEKHAEIAAKFAASVVDPELVDTYIKGGDEVESYVETKESLQKIRDNAAGVIRLYVVKIKDDTMEYVFDLDAIIARQYPGKTVEINGHKNGEIVSLEEAFMEHKDKFAAGESIPPTKVSGPAGLMVATFCPVLNDKGQCVCYAIAEVSVRYVTDYLFEFVWKIMALMLGIVIAILAYGMWNTSIYLVNPISRMSLCVESFIKAGVSQSEIDQAVKELRQINVQTDDEVEKLYKAICDMALNQAEQIRSIRRITEYTTKMQDGLIVTMADLVERSDANSGSHIQKTSAYVKIIVEGLQKKGYYLGKVTPKFVSDVIRSAPLHDIGKINIPDNILKNAGKLTSEEKEILKTHTTAGKRILEDAISTISGENYLKEARNMAAFHHERWDGNGYPEGLHGEIIPLSARIMAVANEFDNLTSTGVDGRVYTFEEAVSMIQDASGSSFDPKCVEVFMDALPEIRVVYRKYNKLRGNSQL